MLFSSPEWLLIGAVFAVGVLHTIAPDHWVPITVIARQQSWTTRQTARAAFIAGVGHTVSTLAIALVVWIAGVAVARSFGRWVDTIASLALVAFGGWIAISAWRDIHGRHRHSHGHGHARSHDHERTHDHGHGTPQEHDLHERRIVLSDGVVELSIHETDARPHFRLAGDATIEQAEAETLRPDGSRRIFALTNRGAFWESVEEIPEPHEFGLTVRIRHGGHEHRLLTAFYEHDHAKPYAHDDPGVGARQRRSRTALLLILGSSPMLEGIPAFFAAGRYGPALIGVMSMVFAVSTIATYVVLCVGSTAGLRRLRLGPFERYGEVLSGTFIAAVGVVFWIWPAI